MEYGWILPVFAYSFLKGTRDGMKKAAIKKNSANEILFFYTLIGLLLTLPFCSSAFSLEPIYIFWAFVKASVVCIAWLFSFVALDGMSVSLFGVMELARMVFSTLLGVFALKEDFTLPKAIGVALVILGLVLVNIKKDSKSKQVSLWIVTASVLNCFFNALSGTLDKILMKHMESSQLQFWFMLFMSLIYGVILLIKREKVSVKSVGTNYWIPLMSISLIIGDRLLFDANASPQSQVTLMTLIKQSSVIVTVITGWLFFKEKNILYKLMCSMIVLSGIFIALL